MAKKKVANEPRYKIGQHFDNSFKGLSEKEIWDNLEGIADKVEEGHYTKALTPEELSEKRAALGDVSISLAKFEQKKKDFMAQLKADMAEPLSEKAELIDAIKHKSVNLEGRLWLVSDQEEGLMYKFDHNGLCVDVRALLPTERQRNVFNLQRAANDE